MSFVEPAYLWVPDHVGTYGDEVIDVAKLAGLNLDAEQELAIRSMMVHDKYGNYVASEICIIEARQNGKTTHVLIPIALWDLFLRPPDDIIWTAHRFKTSSLAFTDIQNMIDGTYEFRRRVKKIIGGHGEESIELINGAVLYFLARSKSGGRGLGGKRPTLDEAFALQSGQLGALLPTILARPDAQVMYGSSACLTDSDVLRELVKRGRAYNDDTLAYVEWCAQGGWDKPTCALRNCNHHRSIEGCALDRPENHQAANPAYLRRIMPRSIATLRKAMTPQEFGREILGWHDPEPIGAVQPIALGDWQACRDELSRVHGPVCIMFDVSPDRSTAAIAIAGKREDDIDHGELIKYDDGVDWLVDEIVKLSRELKLRRIRMDGKTRPAIVCDPAGPAAALLPALRKRKIDPVLMTARDMGAACGGLQDAVAAGPSAWRHIGQGQVDLAIEGAVKRDIGDGAWAFGRKVSAKVSVDICPIVAVAGARWALAVSKPPFEWPDDVDLYGDKAKDDSE
jgi:hypothetical protein